MITTLTATQRVALNHATVAYRRHLEAVFLLALNDPHKVHVSVEELLKLGLDCFQAEYDWAMALKVLDDMAPPPDGGPGFSTQ